MHVTASWHRYNRYTVRYKLDVFVHTQSLRAIINLFMHEYVFGRDTCAVMEYICRKVVNRRLPSSAGLTILGSAHAVSEK